ncbi:MAG: GNAT family N-acetyltransferase [Deltaproteobacteria bacterium]|nr:GNAT family N-acetyltransferase [Deltaproteobacteria bacterium]
MDAHSTVDSVPLKLGSSAKPGLPSEKTFYLEEFHGKSLLFLLVPPSGRSLGERAALRRTLRELARNQTRCVVLAPLALFPRLTEQLGRLLPRRPAPTFNPSEGLRSYPYPPDETVAEIWRGLREGNVLAAAAATGDLPVLGNFALRLAARLGIFKLVILDRAGGLVDTAGRRLPFVQSRRLPSALGRQGAAASRRLLMRLATRALEHGVASVNLASARGLYQELFSFTGSGTLFTRQSYGQVEPISMDDFAEVEALILRGQNEGFLLPRSADEIARLLPSCFVYRVGSERLAGVCCLFAAPYRRERAGEITALYTLTRFKGEGVAAELLHKVVGEARARRLRYVFACTVEDNAARFFSRLEFRRAAPAEVPAAKWRRYDPERLRRLSVFRLDLARPT